MAQVEARAWWVEVEHLRERVERRRAEERSGPGETEPARHRGERPREQSPAHRERTREPSAARRTVRIRGQAIPTVAAPRLRPVEQATRPGPGGPAQPRRSAGRRPRPRPGERGGSRPDRMAMWAVGLGILMVLMAVASGHGAVTARPASGYSHVQLGTRTLARGMSGRDVRTLQHLLGVTPTGYFGTQTKSAVRGFQHGAGLGEDGAVGPRTRRAMVHTRMHAHRVTYYGPGLWGRRTACGERLTRSRLGVAHLSLRCGTPITLLYGSRFVTVPVIDRGPYTHGVSYDLTQATARALGLGGSGELRASP